MDPADFPRDVADAIAKLAVVEMLSIASDLVRPIGIASESLSIDGLSQSQSYLAPAFKQRIDRYSMDLFGPDGKDQFGRVTGGLLRTIHDYYRPPNLSAL